MDAWVAPAIEAAGSIATSLSSGLFGYNQAAKNRSFQERMYEKQLEDNRENWRMVNEYNLPSAQLQRLKDANLNPLLMYGEGGLSGNLAGQSDSASAPHGAQAQANFQNPFVGFTSGIAQMKMLDHQIQNLDADSEKKIQEALESAARTVHTKEDTERVKSEAKFNIESLRDRVESIRVQNRLNEELAKEPAWKIKEIQQNISQIEANTEYLSQQTLSNRQMTEQQIKESNQRIENSIKETAASVAKMNAEARKAAADAIYTAALTKTENATRDYKVLKYGLDVRKALLEGDIEEIEKAMSDWIWSQRPAEGSDAYKYQKFLNTWVNPAFESIGRIFSGSATFSVRPVGRK